MQNIERNKIQIIGLLAGLMLSISSCSSDIPLVSLGLDDVYLHTRMKVLSLKPEFTGQSYRWSMKTTDGRDSLLSTEKDYLFLVADTGIYYLTFEINDTENPVKHEMEVVVFNEQVAYSPYISSVLEYEPAPGQFVNMLPEYEEGDTEEDMRQKAEECISRTNKTLISLGGYGGFVTFKFDHTVINMSGKRDFTIMGNAFYAKTPSVLSSSIVGGSSEPGIVMVSFDANQNGLSDDEWYELAGSEYNKTNTVKNYKIIYTKPDENKLATPDYTHSLSDTTYVKWTDNQSSQGYVSKNVFHTQSYYPQWITDTSISFTGTKLADNAVDTNGDGSYYFQKAYDWGYVDNHPNEAINKDSLNLSSFDIDWAVDKSGNKVHLRGIDFVRVYTALNQYCGWIGETSTEISQAQDLHIYVKPSQQQ